MQNFPKDKLGANIKYSASGFCIESFENGWATIRFVGKGYVGNNSYMHTSMVFRLPVKKELFSALADEENFFLGAFANGVSNDNQ